MNEQIALHLATYRATPARRRTMLVVVVNFLVFAALLALMFYVRATSANWPAGESAPFQFGNLLMVFAMAMSAICGSVTVAVGAHSASLARTEEAVRWVAIAISSWLVFLFLEIVEWISLFYLVELGPRTPFGGTFILLTGTHWLGVVVCVCWFTFVATDVRRRDILAAAIYSHFLAVWWLVLVVTLYFVNSNPFEGF